MSNNYADAIDVLNRRARKYSELKSQFTQFQAAIREAFIKPHQVNGLKHESAGELHSDLSFLDQTFRFSFAMDDGQGRLSLSRVSVDPGEEEEVKELEAVYFDTDGFFEIEDDSRQFPDHAELLVVLWMVSHSQQ